MSYLCAYLRHGTIGGYCKFLSYLVLLRDRVQHKRLRAKWSLSCYILDFIHRSSSKALALN